jgi:hypothetical protein
MATDIEINNQALLLVGATQIQAFDDESREAEVSSALYFTIKETLLSIHPWTFALGQKNLTRITQVPLGDFNYAYQLPTNPKMLKVIKTDPNSRYRIFEDKLYCDNAEVNITYLFDPKEQNYPSFFISALVMELAKFYAAALIQDDTSIQIFTSLAEKELRKARNIDSQQQPPIGIDPQEFSITAIR